MKKYHPWLIPLEAVVFAATFLLGNFTWLYFVFAFVFFLHFGGWFLTLIDRGPFPTFLKVVLGIGSYLLAGALIFGIFFLCFTFGKNLLTEKQNRVQKEEFAACHQQQSPTPTSSGNSFLKIDSCAQLIN